MRNDAETRGGGPSGTESRDWPAWEEWRIPWMDGPGDQQVYGEHTRRPGYLVRSSRNAASARHYFGGTEELGGTPVCTCGFKMQAGLRLDLTDPDLRDILEVPAKWKRVVLPYCVECVSKVYIQIFRLQQDGGVTTHEMNYDPRKHEAFYLNKDLGGNKNVRRYRPFPLIPLELVKLTDEDFPITKTKHINLANGYSRIQIGGFPLYPALDLYKDMRCPFNGGKKMKFLASLADFAEFSSLVDKDLGLHIGGGGVFYFVDWETGWLASNYLCT